LLLTTFHGLYAQGGVAYGDEQVQKAFAHAVKSYDDYLGENSFVYSGISYHNVYAGILGHQFFLEDYWEPGNVTYDHSTYDSIDLMYDVFSDLLLIENFSLSGLPSPIIIYGPKVQNFQLHGYDFIRLEKDTVSNIKEGFYNLMYNSDKIQFFVKRKKELVNANEINTVREKFVVKDRYYIKKDGLFYQVRKKKSVLKVLIDRNKEVKSYIRSKGFDFRETADEQIAQIVGYYDSLL
jgi:hypothetical protein